MKCCRWPPWATMRYSFQSSALILAWISADLPTSPVTSTLALPGFSPSLITVFCPRWARMPRPFSS